MFDVQNTSDSEYGEFCKLTFSTYLPTDLHFLEFCNNLNYHAKNSSCKINFNQVCLQNPTNYITTIAIKLISIYDPEEYTSDPRITKHATLGLLFPKKH